MGFFDFLRGAADQLDFIPGFDPVKDKRGFIGSLFGGRPDPNSAAREGEFGMTPPIVAPGSVSPMGGGFGAPMMPKPSDHMPSYNFLDMLNPFKDTVQMDRDGRASFESAMSQYETDLATAQTNQQSQLRGMWADELGLEGQTRDLYMRDPDTYYSSYAKNLEPQSVSAGNSLVLNGNTDDPFVAQQGNTVTKDAHGRLTTIDQNTGNQVGEAVGPVAAGVLEMTPFEREKLALEREKLDAEIATLEAEASAPDVSGESALRREYLKAIAGFRDTRDSYARIQATDATTAAGQMSLIFQYMKMMDPGSSVREGEFANASNTTGIPGQVLNAYNRAREGKFLNPTQVDEFVAQAGALYAAAEGNYNNEMQYYRGLAGSYDFNDVRTIPDILNSLDDQIAMLERDLAQGD